MCRRPGRAGGAGGPSPTILCMRCFAPLLYSILYGKVGMVQNLGNTFVRVQEYIGNLNYPKGAKPFDLRSFLPVLGPIFSVDGLK